VCIVERRGELLTQRQDAFIRQPALRQQQRVERLPLDQLIAI